MLLVLCLRCNASSSGPPGSVDSGPPGPAECCVGGGQFALCDVCANVDCGQQQGTVCPVYTYGCEGGVPWTSVPDYSQCPAEAGAADAGQDGPVDAQPDAAAAGVATEAGPFDSSTGG
jgi:hypothetical protein